MEHESSVDEETANIGPRGRCRGRNQQATCFSLPTVALPPASTRSRLGPRARRNGNAIEHFSASIVGLHSDLELESGLPCRTVG
jgi:hypothetical protein